eukprot:2566960-Alexandrium_andersonii.AAC.1
MADVLQLLGDGVVEAVQLLGDRQHLCLEGLGDGGTQVLGIPNNLELRRTGGEQRPHYRPSFPDGGPLGLELSPSLSDQAGDGRVRPVHERPLGGLYPTSPPVNAAWRSVTALMVWVASKRNPATLRPCSSGLDWGS